MKDDNLKVLFKESLLMVCRKGYAKQWAGGIPISLEDATTAIVQAVDVAIAVASEQGGAVPVSIRDRARAAAVVAVRGLIRKDGRT